MKRMLLLSLLALPLLMWAHDDHDKPPVVTPEPGTIGLALVAGAGIAIGVWRKRNR